MREKANMAVPDQMPGEEAMDSIIEKQLEWKREVSGEGMNERIRRRSRVGFAGEPDIVEVDGDERKVHAPYLGFRG
jgi:hypothetical protein